MTSMLSFQVHHHCTITAPSLHHDGTILIRSLHHHCAITALRGVGQVIRGWDEGEGMVQ